VLFFIIEIAAINENTIPTVSATATPNQSENIIIIEISNNATMIEAARKLFGNLICSPFSFFADNDSFYTTGIRILRRRISQTTRLALCTVEWDEWKEIFEKLKE